MGQNITPAHAAEEAIGVDIAAKNATVAVQAAGDVAPARPFVIAQTPDGFASFEGQLRQTQIAPAATLVVLEATGSYWITLATTFHHAGYAVSMINPAQAHHVAKALLRRSKTDAIDAQTLTQLATTLQPEPWTPPPAVNHEVQQRLAQRDAWIALRQQVRNQWHALTHQPVVVAAVVARMDALIATLDAQIAEVEAELRPALAGDAAWAAAARRFESIKGIGLVTALWILVSTLTFSLCATPEAATVYAGLAPREAESGTSVRRLFDEIASYQGNPPSLAEVTHLISDWLAAGISIATLMQRYTRMQSEPVRAVYRARLGENAAPAG